MSKRCIVGVGAFLLGGLLVALLVTLGIGYFLDATRLPTYADAIVVLGGENSGFPRTQHALALYRAGSAPLVVFSGGTVRDAGLACSSTQLSQDAAQQLDLPPTAIVLAPEAQSTYDEAVNLGALARENGWHALLLVTDRFHTRRALRTFQSLSPELVISVSTPDDPRYNPSRCWQSESGLLAAATEVLKLGFYWANYGIIPWGGPLDPSMHCSFLVQAVRFGVEGHTEPFKKSGKLCRYCAIIGNTWTTRHEYHE